MRYKFVCKRCQSEQVMETEQNSGHEIIIKLESCEKCPSTRNVIELLNKGSKEQS